VVLDTSIFFPSVHGRREDFRVLCVWIQELTGDRIRESAAHAVGPAGIRKDVPVFSLAVVESHRDASLLEPRDVNGLLGSELGLGEYREEDRGQDRDDGDDDEEFNQSESAPVGI